jgi:hypothetical protein
LFTFVISLVVVGAALFIATRIAIGAAPKPDKPATPVASSAVGRHLAPETEVEPEVEPDVVAGRERPAGRVSPWRRLRSGVLLVLMLTVLGAVAALVIVICGALLLSGLRSAVQ